MVSQKSPLRLLIMTCYFKQNGITYIDYKDVKTLKKFLSQSGKILSAKRTGISRKNQRKFANAVKNARFMALLPYVDLS